MWVALGDDGLTIREDAVDAPYARWDEEGRVSYADPDHPLSAVSSWERLHSLSDVLSAVLDAGLTVELFHEFDVTPAPTPWLERRDDGLYGFPAGHPRFPVTYSLRARRPAA